MRVSAGLVIVGDVVADVPQTFRRLRRFGESEIEHLHGAVGSHFHVRGLQVAMHDAVLVRCFERYSNLSGDRQRFIDGKRAELESVGDRLAVDQFEHERLDAVRFLEAVDRRDVRMIERCEDGCFALEARESIGFEREQLR